MKTKFKRWLRRSYRRGRLPYMALGCVVVLVLLVSSGVWACHRGEKNKTAKVISGQEEKQQNATEKQDTQKKNAQKKDAATDENKEETQGKRVRIRKDLDPDKPMVALTFDDGPFTQVTRSILATLKKYDARATFFVVGNRVPAYSETLQMEYDQGCQIASHTYSHVYLSSLNKKQILRQIRKTDKEVKKVTGEKTMMVRPPGGFVSSTMRKTVPVPMIYWSVDTEDWKSRNTHKVLKRCQNIQDGDIVLMHDLYTTTAQAVEKLVPRLKKKGFQMVTVEELFYYKGIDAKAGRLYASGR